MSSLRRRARDWLTLLGICQAALPNRTLFEDNLEIGPVADTVQIYENEATPRLPRGYRFLGIPPCAQWQILAARQARLRVAKTVPLRATFFPGQHKAGRRA